jgi:AcrR family transcriptional regulator
MLYGMEGSNDVRKTAKDWLEAGLQILGTAGVGGLTIERMTAELGVTKGSFYHHFQNVRDFERQLVAHWADQYLSTSAEVPHDPAARLVLLDTIMAEAFSPVTEPEVAIRHWAQQDEMVRASVELVDAVRRAFVQDVFRPLATGEAQAQLMADLLFAVMIGTITALPRLPAQRVLELYHEFKRLYGLDAPAGGRS